MLAPSPRALTQFSPPSDPAHGSPPEDHDQTSNLRHSRDTFLPNAEGLTPRILSLPFRRDMSGVGPPEAIAFTELLGPQSLLPSPSQGLLIPLG